MVIVDADWLLCYEEAIKKECLDGSGEEEEEQILHGQTRYHVHHVECTQTANAIANTASHIIIIIINIIIIICVKIIIIIIVVNSTIMDNIIIVVIIHGVFMTREHGGEHVDNGGQTDQQANPHGFPPPGSYELRFI